MGFFYEGIVYFVFLFKVYGFERQIFGDMVYSFEYGENYLVSEDKWIKE